jgi:signal transduction histidine kinase
MKPLSIKAKVTIWYTSLLVVVLALVLVFVLFFSDTLMLSKAKGNLMDIVISNAEEIHTTNGALDLSDLERFDNGVNVLVHTLSGNLLFGQYPVDFPEKFAWTNGDVQNVSSVGKKWIVYDHLVKSQDQKDILVRGILSVDAVNQTINIAAITAVVLFPILILLAAFGGYRITQRAFRPVKQIADAASDISVGDDLSRRIGLTEFTGSGDEIQSLAETFDAMFDRLQKSFERERQFTADASHELRTPTAVIMLQSEYALSSMDQKEDVKDSLYIILQQSQKMSGLISQLLLLTRTDKCGNTLDLEYFDFSELAEIVTIEMKLSAKSSEIEILTEIEPGLMIKADHLLMTRLLMNILTNGIKYGKNGGFVKLRILKAENRLVCHISDNGIGIDKKNLDKIWDRFYQVNPSRTADNTESMGFGLAMAKWIIDAHHGSITVQSILGEGSTFSFSIPISSK